MYDGGHNPAGTLLVVVNHVMNEELRQLVSTVARFARFARFVSAKFVKFSCVCLLWCKASYLINLSSAPVSRLCVKLSVSQGLTREVISTIQSLRKSTKLVVSDVVDVLFEGMCCAAIHCVDVHCSC